MKIAAAIAALFLAGTALADAPRVLPLLRDGITSDNAGAKGLNVSHDVDGDGIRDIVTCAAGNAFVLAKRGSGFATIWYSEQLGCTAVRVGDRNGDGVPEIYVASERVLSDGPVIRIFDPRSPGAAIGTVTLPGMAEVNDLALGDPDHDGHLEIVAVTTEATYVYDAKTLVREWTATDRGGYEVAIGNIDDDGRIEVVVNGSTGWVLDAYARATEWGYIGGFGARMKLGNVDADAELEIVWIGVYASKVTILEGDTATVSEMPLSHSTQSLGLADMNGDGVDEILTGDSSWGYVRGFRRSDGVQLWLVPNPEYGTMAVAGADVDGDGQAEFIWGAGAESSGKDALFVGGLGGQIEWSTPDLDGPFYTTVADIDGDGRREQIIATRSTNSGYSGAHLAIVDFLTREPKGTLPMPGPFSSNLSGIAVAQLDADPALEILGIHSTLMVWDGVTRELEWTSPNTMAFTPGALEVRNIDGDPVDEIIVGMGTKVIALNGASSIIQWTTPALEGFSIIDLAVADLNGNGALDVVIGTTAALYVFDLPSTTERVKVPLSSILSVAATSANGGEFAVGRNNYPNFHVHAYSGTTLAQSWQCAMPEPASVMTYGNLAGRMRLAVGTATGELRLYPLGASSCPAPETAKLGRHPIVTLSLTDLTGDGRNDLLFTHASLWALYLFGWESEPRGDVNADGIVSDADIDALVAHLLGGAPGAPPGADVNADGRIALDDVFRLIDYRRGTGPALAP